MLGFTALCFTKSVVLGTFISWLDLSIQLTEAWKVVGHSPIQITLNNRDKVGSTS